jgi:hypothetical protein
LINDGEVPELRRLHKESGFDFKFPEFENDPNFPIQLSLRHEGQLLAAVLGKTQCEVILFLNHFVGTPLERKTGLELLQLFLFHQARRMGLDELFCVLPPEVEKSFGPRLEAAGWVRDRGWTKYTRHL